MINIKGGFDAAQHYAAEHEAPDLEAMIGNPTWRQRFAYVRKQIIDGVNIIVPSGVLLAVPAPASYYIAGGLALTGWVLHFQVPNGPKPPVKDKTGWVAASTPPPSNAVPPKVDQVTAADIDGDRQPAMSALDADAEIDAEDNAAAKTKEA